MAGFVDSYHNLVISGGGGGGQRYNDDRHLQFVMPDYTSPPLPLALALTPEGFRSDGAVEEMRELDAAGNCSTAAPRRCHIPFPVDEAAGFAEPPSRVGVVFYNGGLVDPRGYAPIASLLNERYGLPVVMPVFASDLAFAFGRCDSNRLDHARAEFPQIERWVLAGHSFGGVAASADFWSRYETDDSVAGLVLLAADLQAELGCGDNLTDSGVPMAQLLAANDGVLNRTRVDANSFRNSAETIFVEIAGANHASFGAYDSSERFELLGQVDGEQSLPSEIVWDLAAAAIAGVAARTGVPLPTPVVAGSNNGPAPANSSSPLVPTPPIGGSTANETLPADSSLVPAPIGSTNGTIVPDGSLPTTGSTNGTLIPDSSSAGPAALHPPALSFWSTLLCLGVLLLWKR